MLFVFLCFFFFLFIYEPSMRLPLTPWSPVPPRTAAGQGTRPVSEMCEGCAASGRVSARCVHRGELMLPGKQMMGGKPVIKTCKTVCGFED